MSEWFESATRVAVLAINAIALVVIVYGAADAFARIVRAMFAPLSDAVRREIGLRFARWLIAGLTFQLAADILETSVRTDWRSIGQLAAIAVVRTFLNYFLERDLASLESKPTQTR
jgi:uncharacterized membrane protein